MESDKIPFLLEDLVSQLTDTLECPSQTQTPTNHLPPRPTPSPQMQQLISTLTTPGLRTLDMCDVSRERQLLGKPRFYFELVWDSFEFGPALSCVRQLRGCARFSVFCRSAFARPRLENLSL